jgi:serine/threonine protein kinase
MVYDSGTDGDLAYIVMEYVQGASLRQVLVSQGVLPINVTAALAVDVLAALGHAHERGIVHRDVKPANLLLDSGGNVKVADFGISKSFSELTELTAEGAFVGTSTYASPEQLSGGIVGTTSDLYSLGCVLFQCLTGRPPYVAEQAGQRVLQHRFADLPSLMDLRTDLPLELSDGISRALAKEPSDRFPCAAELREVFIPYASHDEVHTLLSRMEITLDGDPTERTESELTPAIPRGSIHRALLPSGSSHSVSTISFEPKRLSRPISVIVAAALLLILVTVVVLLEVGGGHSGNTTRVSTISSGGYLQPGHSMVSPNGRYSLVMQSDGNLVEYSTPSRIVQWESGTSGNFNAYVVMQSDGNLVIYPPGKTAPAPGQPTSAIWQTGTLGHPGASSSLLNSGVLVVRSPGSGGVLWATPTPFAQ